MTNSPAPNTKELWIQLAFVLASTLFATITLSLPMILDSSLYHDSLKFSSLYRDNLHCLNVFGSYAWWNPRASGGAGFPFYYFAFVGTNTGGPLMTLTAFLVWLLGRLGFIISSYSTLYILYLTFVVPLMFQASVLCMARHILKSRLAIFFTLFVSAFAPPVVLNLTDVGLLELSTYSFFLTAAYVSFLKQPGLPTYLGLLFCAMLVATALNFYSLFWNAIYIPAFFLAIHVFLFRPSHRRLLKRAWTRLPIRDHVLAAIVLLIGISTVAICSSQGNNIVRTSIGTRMYAFEQLRPGNPLEFLCSGAPMLAFGWTDVGWAPLTDFDGVRHYSYIYCGALVLPLAIIGILFGPQRWKIPMLLLLGLFSMVILLSAWSPLFGLLLRLPSPLNTVNHYSDVAYRNGLSVLLILAAGMGFERLALHSRRREIVLFVWVLLLFAIFSVSMTVINLLLTAVPERETHQNLTGFFCSYLFGFYCMVVLGAIVVSLSLMKTRSNQLRAVFACLLAVIAILDISTSAEWLVRTNYWPKAQRLPEAPASQIGSGSEYSQNFLAVKSTMNLFLANVPLGKLPPCGLFSRVRPAATAADIKQALDAGQLDTLLVEPSALSSPEIAEVNSQPAQTPAGSVLRATQTYNTFDAEVQSAQSAMFFYRDTYFPFWSATVNGKPAQIFEAFGAFKAVPVPAGPSTIHFEFHPPMAGVSLLISRTLLVLTLVAWILALRAFRKRHPPAMKTLAMQELEIAGGSD